MARIGLDRLFAFVSHCHVALDRTGLHVEQATHPNDVAKAAEILRVPRFRRTLDPALSDFTAANTIWLFVYHRADSAEQRRLIGIVGARVETLAPGEFTSALKNRMSRLYSVTNKPAVRPSPPPPIFDEISGRVVYVDDLYILPAFREQDGVNLRALLLLLFSYARVEWDFDWLYGFIATDHAARDYLSTYCFASTYPSALGWNVQTTDRADTDIFGCTSREDFAYLVDLIARQPGLLTEPEQG